MATGFAPLEITRIGKRIFRSSLLPRELPSVPGRALALQNIWFKKLKNMGNLVDALGLEPRTR